MRQIALVGTTSSGAEAPYHDENWEIWGVSARAAYVTRADRWFELHRLDGEGEEWANNWRRTIKTFSHDVELMMFYPEPDLGPRVVAYPYDRIVDRFGTYFMTSTFAWMMALAIDELRPASGTPVEGEIGVWGVDMEYGTEYRQQRAGFRHFFDMARAMGIAVSRFADTGLSFEPVPYPLWQDDPMLNKLYKRGKETHQNIKDFDESLRQVRTLIAQDRALIAEIEGSKKKGYRRTKRLAALEKELTGLLETSATLSKDIVHWNAIDEEQKYWDDYLRP